MTTIIICLKVAEQSVSTRIGEEVSTRIGEEVGCLPPSTEPLKRFVPVITLRGVSFYQNRLEQESGAELFWEGATSFKKQFIKLYCTMVVVVLRIISNLRLLLFCNLNISVECLALLSPCPLWAVHSHYSSKALPFPNDA